MKKTILAILVLMGSVSISFANGPHPRRAQVNRRLENQHDRIHDKVADGQMSKREAAKLLKEDRQIRKEEKIMASQNNGHITKQEQKTLNQQENKVSNQIKN